MLKVFPLMGALWLAIISPRHAATFSNENFVVEFSPLVSKHDISGSGNDFHNEVEIIRMVETISTKFNRILMPGWEPALHTNLDADIREIPLAVAKFNRDLRMKGQVPLELIMQYNHDSEISSSNRQHHIQFLVTKADRTNNIFPGTVKTLLYHIRSDVDNSDIFQGLSILNKLTSKNPKHAYNVGAIINSEQNYLDRISTLFRLPYMREIVFTMNPDPDNLLQGADAWLQTVSANFIKCKAKIKMTGGHPNLKFGVKGGWPDTTKAGRNVSQLVQFWEGMNNWGVRADTTVYLQQAFDTPNSGVENNSTGWWKLANDEPYPTNLVFEEKKLLLLKENTATTKPPSETTTPPATVTTFPPPIPTTPNFFTTTTTTTTTTTIPPTSSRFPVSITSSTPTPSISTFQPIAQVTTHASVNAITAGLLLVLLFISLVILGASGIFIVYSRMSKMVKLNARNSPLTKEEIGEFFNGRENHSYEYPELAEIPNSGYNTAIEIHKDSFTIDEKRILGSGAFGQVLQATVVKCGVQMEVAVKRAKTLCPSIALKGLLSEIKILSYLGSHENIVSIVGAYTAELENGKVFVFTELCTLGSLDKYLRRKKPEILNMAWNKQLDQKKSEHVTALLANEEQVCLQIDSELSSDLALWSSQIAKAMEFLAAKHVVHADLAARNVLLTGQKIAKVSDFGLSRRMYDYTSYVKSQQEPLPWRWMAPESLRHMEFNEKSDVWAFGVTLWEIFSMANIPYSGLSWSVNFAGHLEQGLRLETPEFDNDDWYSIMLRCWETVPQLRPSFSDLNGIIAENIAARNRKLEGSISSHNILYTET